MIVWIYTIFTTDQIWYQCVSKYDIHVCDINTIVNITDSVETYIHTCTTLDQHLHSGAAVYTMGQPFTQGDTTGDTTGDSRLYNDITGQLFLFSYAFKWDSHAVT